MLNDDDEKKKKKKKRNKKNPRPIKCGLKGRVLLSVSLDGGGDDDDGDEAASASGFPLPACLPASWLTVGRWQGVDDETCIYNPQRIILLLFTVSHSHTLRSIAHSFFVVVCIVLAGQWLFISI